MPDDALLDFSGPGGSQIAAGKQISHELANVQLCCLTSALQPDCSRSDFGVSDASYSCSACSRHSQRDVFAGYRRLFGEAMQRSESLSGQRALVDMDSSAAAVRSQHSIHLT